MTSVVVALVAIILIKIVIEILDNKGDLFVALVAIILIKNDMEMLKVKDSLGLTCTCICCSLFFISVNFFFPLF